MQSATITELERLMTTSQKIDEWDEYPMLVHTDTEETALGGRVPEALKQLLAELG